MEAAYGTVPDDLGAACADELPQLNSDLQSAVVDNYIRETRKYLPAERLPELITKLSSDNQRRMSAFGALKIMREDDAMERLDAMAADPANVADEVASILIERARAEVIGLSGDRDRQTIMYDKLMPRAKAAGLIRMVPSLQYGYGVIAARQGRLADAIGHYRASTISYEQVDNLKARDVSCDGLAATIINLDFTSPEGREVLEAVNNAGLALWAGCAFQGMSWKTGHDGDIDLSNQYASKAEEIYQRHNAEGMLAMLYLSDANTEMFAQNFANSIALAQKAMDIGTRLKDQSIVYNANKYLAGIYSDLGQHDKAITLFEAALDATQGTNLALTSSVEANIVKEIGVQQYWAGRPAEALETLTRAGKIFQTTDAYMSGYTDFHMAKSLYDLGRMDDALERAQAALERYDGPMDGIKKAAVLTWIAERHLESGNDDLSYSRLTEAKDLIEASGTSVEDLPSLGGYKFWNLEYAESMANMMKRMGKPEMAIPYLEAAAKISKAQYRGDNMKALANTELMFAVRDREQDLRLMQRNGELKDLQLQRSQLLGILSLMGVGLVGLLAFILYRSYRYQRQLVLTRDMFLSEIHHRTKNNLQLLSSLLRIDARRKKDISKSPGSRYDSANRARTMALVHDHLYMSSDTSEVDTHELIIELLALLDSSLGRSEIIVTSDIENAQVNVDTATPLGLVLSEIMTNAYKHAFGLEGGTLHVELASKDNSLTLRIQDNGRGFDLNKARNKSGSMGLSIIEDMVKQMNASLNVRSNEQGSCWTISGIPQH